MTLQERFEQFHQQNPHIYDMLVELSRKMKAKKNMKQWSVYAAYELVRYQCRQTRIARRMLGQAMRNLDDRLRLLSRKPAVDK